jgi:hypothetical protein
VAGALVVVSAGTVVSGRVVVGAAVVGTAAVVVVRGPVVAGGRVDVARAVVVVLGTEVAGLALVLGEDVVEGGLVVVGAWLLLFPLRLAITAARATRASTTTRMSHQRLFHHAVVPDAGPTGTGLVGGRSDGGRPTCRA